MQQRPPLPRYALPRQRPLWKISVAIAGGILLACSVLCGVVFGVGFFLNMRLPPGFWTKPASAISDPVVLPSVSGAAAASDPSPTPDTSDNIKIVDLSVYDSASGSYVNVDGIVKNTSTRSMRFIKVFVELHDSQGNFLGTDSTYTDVDRLAPGETSTFKIFTQKLQGMTAAKVRNVTWDWGD